MPNEGLVLVFDPKNIEDLLHLPQGGLKLVRLRPLPCLLPRAAKQLRSSLVQHLCADHTFPFAMDLHVITTGGSVLVAQVVDGRLVLPAEPMKPPLTREQLEAIQARNTYSTDVRTLLWEIKRLRALTLRTHDYLRQDATSSMGLVMAERLRRDLDAEPCVKEQTKL
jgi:hypothetical protein